MVSKFRQFVSLALTAWLVMMSQLALADPAPFRGPMTVSDLDTIMQDEIIFRARVARAKQEAELARFDESSARPGTRANTLPQVSWRRATAAGWLAKFVFRDGTSLIAGKGEPLPGGLEVAEINEQGVQLLRGSELIDLTAAGSRTSDTERSQGVMGQQEANGLPGSIITTPM